MLDPFTALLVFPMFLLFLTVLMLPPFKPFLKF